MMANFIAHCAVEFSSREKRTSATLYPSITQWSKLKSQWRKTQRRGREGANGERNRTMEMSKENMEQNKDDARAYLAPVPYDHGFHFFTEVGRYTGETAISLATFARDVEVAPIESINFHFARADFQKWIAETIGDAELAAAIEKVEKNLAGEPLRLRLLEIINAHVKELES